MENPHHSRHPDLSKHCHTQAAIRQMPHVSLILRLELASPSASSSSIQHLAQSNSQERTKLSVRMSKLIVLHAGGLHAFSYKCIKNGSRNQHSACKDPTDVTSHHWKPAFGFGTYATTQECISANALGTHRNTHTHTHTRLSAAISRVCFSACRAQRDN